MHIRSLDIQNFRAISRFSLRFEDAIGRVRKTVVIAGPNGCGKTSVLNAIVQALRGAMRARIPDVSPPSDDDVYRAEPSGRRPVTATVDIELVYEQAELDAIVRVFDVTRALRENVGKAALNPPPLPNGRLTVHWQYPPRLLRDGSRAEVSDLRSEPDHGVVWLAGPSDAWRGWKNRLLQAITDTYPIGMLRVFPQDRDRRWGIDVDDSDDDAVKQSGEPTVENGLRSLGEWAHGQGLGEQDDQRHWESQLQDRFKKICGPKEYLGYYVEHPRYGKTPLLGDRGREYPFRSAASGELVILHYLTKFTLPHPVNNSLILIDEPELHLHPWWIRQLYHALPLIGDNNQFIMTTHSPELRRLASQDNALVDMGDLARSPADADTTPVS